MTIREMNKISEKIKNAFQTNNDLELSQISGAARTATRAVHAAQHAMVAKKTRGEETRARKRKRDLAAQTGVAIPGLSFDVAVFLIQKHLPDPADLAVLRAVSRGMRAAVDATGRKVEGFGEDDAVERGYVSTLKCLHRRGRLSDERLVCAAAARIGDFEALKALRAAKWPSGTWTCSFLAWGGHLEMLKWARENDFPWDEETCANAAEGGHLETLKWARANDCPWDEWTCANAAEGGHLEVLKWARANDCPWGEWTCANAAMCGHLEVLQWLRANGCPWNEDTCTWAAYGGHFEVLKWAHEYDCPWNENTCYYAAKYGHLEVLKWARENGCPWHEYTCQLAARKGYVES